MSMSLHDPVAAPSAAKPAIDPRLIASLAAVYVIWSSTYLGIRIAVHELPPFLMAAIRYCAAGVIMLGVARRRGGAWPSPRQWLRTVPVGALLFVGGNGFIAMGEQTVSSGGAAVVCATMPLWLGVLSVVTGERPSRREWFSLVLGFIGVVVLMGGPSLDGRPLHVVLILLAPICWSLGSVLSRRRAAASELAGAKLDTTMSSAMQMLTGGAALAVTGVFAGEAMPAYASAQAWLAVAYLAVFGSLIAFTAYNWLLRNARATVATSYAYVNPILAVVFGAAVSGERLGVTTLVANLLIAGAVALALRRPRGPGARR